MDASDVMARVKAILEETFQEPVFVDRLPKDFKRPSFALELQKTEMADLNLFLVRKTTTVLITGFVDVDYYHDSSREELGLRQDRVMALFPGPSMEVEGYHPTIAANKGTGAPDFFEVQLAVVWRDARPGFQDPEDSAPPMEDFEVNGYLIAGGDDAGKERMR